MMLPKVAEFRGQTAGARVARELLLRRRNDEPVGAANHAMQQLPLTPIGAAVLPTAASLPTASRAAGAGFPAGSVGGFAGMVTDAAAQSGAAMAEAATRTGNGSRPDEQRPEVSSPDLRGADKRAFGVDSETASGAPSANPEPTAQLPATNRIRAPAPPNSKTHAPASAPAVEKLLPAEALAPEVHVAPDAAFSVAGALTHGPRLNAVAPSTTGTTDPGQAPPQVGDATARTALDAGEQQPAGGQPEPSVIPAKAAIVTAAAHSAATLSPAQDEAAATGIPTPTVPVLFGPFAPPAASPPGNDAPQAAARGTSGAAASPAEQLGKVLIAATTTQAGNRQLMVRLDPPELGHVRIAITQPREGGAAVTLTVERPETLLMVLRDEQALHSALDRAGVPAEARTVSFELAPQREAPSPAQPQGHLPAGAPAFDLAARDHGQRPPRPMATALPDPATTETDEPADSQRVYVAMWRRAGIDITA